MEKPKQEKVILFEALGDEKFSDDLLQLYHTHIFCNRGSAEFTFNDKLYQCRSGEFIFWFAASKIDRLSFSRNFKASVLLVEKEFLNNNIPDISRSIEATLHSREFPVLHLHDKKDRKRILLNFKILYDKYLQKDHRYYNELLNLQMRLFLLEMWHTFANEFEIRKRSLHKGTLYERFIHLVQEHCIKEREVRFYADQLYISPKYLNFICKQNSGITASQWIQRFTKERIEILLQNSKLNITEIADKMGFSSRSFFTRYVKKILGVTPSEYRNRMT